MTGGMLGLLILIFICQVWLYCRRKCCCKKKASSKNGSKKDEKKRAKNGMVVAGLDDDQEEEEDANGDYEMAINDEPGKKPDKG